MVSEKAMDAIDQVITPTDAPTPAPQEAAWISNSQNKRLTLWIKDRLANHI